MSHDQILLDKNEFATCCFTPAFLESKRNWICWEIPLTCIFSLLKAPYGREPQLQYVVESPSLLLMKNFYANKSSIL